MQPTMRWACDRLKGVWRIIAADIFLFFSFIGTINVWRGVWGALDVYFIPGKMLIYSKCYQMFKILIFFLKKTKSLVML